MWQRMWRERTVGTVRLKEDEQAGQEGQGPCCEWVEQNGSETVSAEEWI